MPLIEDQLSVLMEILIDKRIQITQPACECDIINENFKHICAVLDKNGNIMSIGYNTYHTNQKDTEHAEVMAMRKMLEKLRAMRTKKKYEVSLFVMRTNCRSSKPCVNCINTMNFYSKYFTIKNVYYTDETVNSGIKKMKLRDLIADPDKHQAGYYRFIAKNTLHAFTNL
jgi:tRNA(Arg) A34 adenosine deaminase TadA